MTADNIRAILTYAKDSGLNAEVFIKHDFLIFFDYPFVFEVDDEYLYKAVSNNDWIKCRLDSIDSIRVFEP